MTVRRPSSPPALPCPGSEYVGGQRDALIGGALFEGLAATRQEAIDGFEIRHNRRRGLSRLRRGRLAGRHLHGLDARLRRGEPNPRQHRLLQLLRGQGAAAAQLRLLRRWGPRASAARQRRVLAPVVGEAIRRQGGIALKPLIARALRMGDEVHSRNAAASLLFNGEILLSRSRHDRGGRPGRPRHDAPPRRERLLLPAALDGRLQGECRRERGVVGSTLVSAMAFSCRGFAIQVAGLGDQWFEGPPPVPPGQALPRSHRGRDHLDGRGSRSPRPSGWAASPRPARSRCRSTRAARRR